MNTAMFRAFALLGLLATSARGAIIDHSMVIDAEHSFPGQAVELVEGTNPPTVVDFVNGGIIGPPPYIITRDNSQINLLGGSFAEDYSSPRVRLFDESKVVVARRYDSLLIDSKDSSIVSLRPGSSAHAIAAFDRSSIRVEAAHLRAGVTVSNKATARLIDVERIDGPLGAGADYEGVLKISNCDFDIIAATFNGIVWIDGNGVRMVAADSAELHWVGGSHFSDTIDVIGDAVLHVYGYDMALTFDDGGRPRAVHGLRKDGSPFYSPVLVLDDAKIIFHTVPEPTSAASLSAGIAALAFALRRRVAR